MTRSHHMTSDLLAGPPPEVMAEVDAAWERAQALVDGELELHFEGDELTHRAYGELRRPDGGLVRRISARQALAIACGEPLPRFAAALAV